MDFDLFQTVSRENQSERFRLNLIFRPEELNTFVESGFVFGIQQHRLRLGYASTELNYFGNYFIRTIGFIRDQGIRKKTTIEQWTLNYQFHFAPIDIIDLYSGISYAYQSIKIKATDTSYFWSLSENNYHDITNAFEESNGMIGITLGAEVYFQQLLSMNAEVGLMNTYDYSYVFRDQYLVYRGGFTIYIF